MIYHSNHSNDPVSYGSVDPTTQQSCMVEEQLKAELRQRVPRSSSTIAALQPAKKQEVKPLEEKAEETEKK